MSESKFTSIAVKKEPTLLQLQRIGRFGMTYDDIVQLLLSKCEREILEQMAEESLTITQK
jgi:hypothetical protein